MKLIPGFVSPKLFLLLSSLCLLMFNAAAQDDFRVYPYLQNPSPDGITVIWFSNFNISGQLSYREEARRSGEDEPTAMTGTAVAVCTSFDVNGRHNRCE